MTAFGALSSRNRCSTEVGIHCLCAAHAALDVFSRPALLSGIGTRPSHDGVQ